MKHHQQDRYHLYEATEFQSQYDDWGMHLAAIADIFLRRPLIRQLVKAYGEKHEKREIHRLNAHGGVYKKRWSFVDGKKRYDLQEWITKHERNASALLIEVCNPENLEITAQKTIVIHPQRCLSRIDLIRGRNRERLRVYVPEHGYVEESYRAIHAALNDIKKI